MGLLATNRTENEDCRTEKSGGFQIGNKMPGDHDRHRDGGGAGRAGRTWNGGGDGRLMTYDELASLEYPAEPDLARGSGILLLIARFERGG